MNYTHQALISADASPRPQCGGSGRSVMRIADVDCPGCLQLEADRVARIAEPEPEPEPDAPLPPPLQPLMLTEEVAEAFQVSLWQPLRWAKAGRITCVRTPGGHPRYLRAEVEALLVSTAEGTR